MEDAEYLPEHLISLLADNFNDDISVPFNENEATHWNRVEDSDFDAHTLGRNDVDHRLQNEAMQWNRLEYSGFYSHTLRRDVVDHPLQKFVDLNSVFMKNEKGNIPILDYLLVSESMVPKECRTREWFLAYLRDIIPGHVFHGSHFLAAHAIEHFEFTKSGKKWFNLCDKASDMSSESIEMIQNFKNAWFVAWDALLMEFKTGSLRTMFHNGRGCFFRVKKLNCTDKESDTNSSLHGESIESGDTSHDSRSSDGANGPKKNGGNKKRRRQGEPDAGAGGGNGHGGIVAAGDVPQDDGDAEEDNASGSTDGDDIKDYVIVYASSTTHSDISGLTEESILTDEGLTNIPEKDTEDVGDHGDTQNASPPSESNGVENDARANNEVTLDETAASHEVTSLSDTASITTPTVSDITAPTGMDPKETHTPHHRCKNKSTQEPAHVRDCDLESTVDTEIGRYRSKGPHLPVDGDDNNDFATETYDHDLPDDNDNDDEEHSSHSSKTPSLGKYNQRDRSKKVSYLGLQALHKSHMSLVEAVRAMNNEVLVNARYVSLSEVLSIVSQKVATLPASLRQLNEQLVQQQSVAVSENSSAMAFLRTLQPITGAQLRLCLDGNKTDLQATGVVNWDNDTIFVPRGRDPLYRPLWNELSVGKVKPTVTEKHVESWLQEGRTYAVKITQVSKRRGTSSTKGIM